MESKEPVCAAEQHDTLTAYKRGCRCPQAVRLNKHARVRSERNPHRCARPHRITTDDALIDRSECRASKHGTVHAYRAYGCRCADALADRARIARHSRQRNYVPRRVDATGTRRRVRALCLLGWSLQDQAARLSGAQAWVHCARYIAATRAPQNSPRRCERCTTSCVTPGGRRGRRGCVPSATAC